MAVQLRNCGTIQELEGLSDYHGSHFFSPGAKRFFKSRGHWQVWQSRHGAAFITSEQGPHMARAYTVRVASFGTTPAGQDDFTRMHFDEYPGTSFQQFATLARAKSYLLKALKAEEVTNG